MEKHYCPDCKTEISPTANFCPSCGKKFRDGPVVISVGRQISIYAVSILLPPLGLWPGFKYLFQKDSKAKVVGIIAIVLTIISGILSYWLTMEMFKAPMDQLTTQLNQLNELR
jgi:hypothetical protein